jgi:hypothetical protein
VGERCDCLITTAQDTVLCMPSELLVMVAGRHQTGRQVDRQTCLNTIQSGYDF